MSLTLYGSGNISSTSNITLTASNLIVNKSNRPSFLIRSSGFSTLTNAILTFTNVVYNNGNMYDTSTGRMTAPVDGLYLLQLNALTPNNSTTADLRLYKNGSQYSDIGIYGGNWSGHKHIGCCLPIVLSAGDWIAWYTTGTGYFHSGTEHTWLAGALLV